MTRYLIFNTQIEAETAQKKIFDTSLGRYRLKGYQADKDGLIGMREGKPDLTAGRTTAWDVPMQRKDGKWVILSPEHHPEAQHVDLVKGKMIDEVNTKIGVRIAEVRNDTWFFTGVDLKTTKRSIQNPIV